MDPCPRHAMTGLLVALLALPTLALAAQPTDDAPDEWSHAKRAPASAWSGALDPARGDAADWWRVPRPIGLAARVAVHVTAGDALVVARDDAGRVLAWARAAPDAPAVLDAAPSGASVRVGVSTRSDEPVEYAVNVTLPQAVDLRVTRVLVTPEDVRTPLGPVAPWPRRAVHATVENAGPADAAGARVGAFVTRPGEAPRALGEAAVEVPAGGNVTVTLPWHPELARTGSVRVTGWAWHAHDAHTGDNAVDAAAVVGVALR